MENQLEKENRARGCLLGLAIGDALGTTVEFCERGTFEPVTDMVGGGPFDLDAGKWTDDTSMALCLAESLIRKQGIDLADQMNRYCNWMNFGYLSSTGVCFDVGMTVAAALQRYIATGNPLQGSPDPRSAGNGALMRLAPVPIFYRDDLPNLLKAAADCTRTTHGAEECIEASQLFAGQLWLALKGADKDAVLFGVPHTYYTPAISRIARGDWQYKAESEVRGSGYVVESLEAALWCFFHTDSFSAAVLKAVNLGEDADTTAAICGQLAGAFYGEAAIPEAWRERLHLGAEIAAVAERLSSVVGE
ncbi:ADP-ribosyl-[dinitrogen reductase] hydrolase [Chitinivorax tropicus]|uniref:ADP-ribosyl-[dinitrogen reductase] hydrolase n=1 Tax=Chitinivorax tropicus TaxID=714531 RepID=A0A840MEJ3_9PROT|nr:ADP-ribosylglycohydrolase family protein [Chitinivorax tropicus]MBB5016820.1 ADP-ribosyl-[dinitrogen reductase] hydrolase [Chitinivorax tropicus]